MNAEEKCIFDACITYKDLVSKNGPDGTPGLNNIYDVKDFYKVIIDNIDEFREYILNHPFFIDKYDECDDIIPIYEKENSLFIYCMQVFLNKKFGNGLEGIDDNIIIDPIEIPTEIVTDAAINTKKEYVSPECECEELKNKKEFVKEVLEGVEHKKTLKEFLSDPRSYRQFRDDVDRCLLYMDWEKIHRVMKKLKWKWSKWIDNEFNEHTNTVPSVFGIKDHVYDMIKRMEDWILEHGDDDRYLCGTGGFEYEMYICKESDVDDYYHRVRFVVRFVVEQFDNGL